LRKYCRLLTVTFPQTSLYGLSNFFILMLQPYACSGRSAELSFGNFCGTLEMRLSVQLFPVFAFTMPLFARVTNFLPVHQKFHIIHYFSSFLVSGCASVYLCIMYSCSHL
jgi:hypothetical protein